MWLCNHELVEEDGRLGWRICRSFGSARGRDRCVEYLESLNSKRSRLVTATKMCVNDV